MRTPGRIVLVALLVLLGSTAFAQYAGSLRGTVSDSTGAVVPGATVTLTNDATKAVRSVVTDAKGAYYLGALQPGSYGFAVEIPGFKTVSRKGIRISPNENSGFDVTLEVGAQSERVEVTAQREMIQTQTGAREGLVTAEQIDNLSMIGRSPLELLRILPGSVTPDLTQLESVGNGTGVGNTSGYAVNGVRGTNNVVSLDGSKLMDVGSNSGVIVVPNNDMVSEVKVQSSNYAAEYGSAGVQINAITKGGGSEFHGTLYDYLRHYKVQANDRTNSITGTPRPKSKFQYPGGNLSGPILIPGTGFNKNRDKAFFFFGAEVQRQQVDNGSVFGVVPTANQQQGIFNGDWIGGQNLNQGTGTVNIPGGFPGAGSPAPGGNLNPYNTPLGQALMKMYPLPTGSYNNNRYNYVFSQLEPQNRLQMVMRLDYNFSDNTKAYLRLASDGEELDKARGVWWNSSDVAMPTSNVHKNKGRSAALNVTSVLSPTTTNEVVFGFSKLWLDIFHRDPSKVSLSALGLSNFKGPYGQQVDVAPVQIYSWGQGLGNLWDPLGQDVYAYNSSLMLNDTFTKVFNTHAVKAGFSVERVRKDQNFQNNEQMSITLGAGWIPGTTGSDYGDLLVGRPASMGAGTLAKDGNFQLWNFDWFVQDSWKVRKNFTLEYGVRFAKWPNNQERNGLAAVFLDEFYDPSKGAYTDDTYRYVNGLAYVQLGQVDKSLIGNRPIFIMPRANFAWDIKGDGDLIVRGGAGVFYNRPQGNAEYDVIKYPPNAYGIGVGAYDSIPGGNGLTYDSIALLDPLTRVGTQSLTRLMNPADVNVFPRIFSTSLSVGKRLPWQQFLEMSYVGTFGRHLSQIRMFNVIPEGSLLKGQLGNANLNIPVNRMALSTEALSTQRPYSGLNELEYFEYGGSSNYHSLQATLSRQTSGRLQYFVAYTFSKALGTETNETGNNVDPFDARNRSYGLLPYDRTHILNISWNWQAPDVTKGENKLARGLLNGWQFSGISFFTSGTPMQFKFAGDLGAGGGINTAWAGTPDVSSDGVSTGAVPPLIPCNPREGGSGNLGDKLLNIGCVGIPTFPDKGPYIQPYYMRSPNRMSHDLTIFKNFGLGGNKKLQFRAGFFNIFNMAYATYGQGFNDIDLTLQTTCNVRVNGVPNGSGGTSDNVCDPTGGYSYTENTLANFGKVNLKRGRRIVEFALKFYF